MPDLIDIICSNDPAIRDTSLDSQCCDLTADQLSTQCQRLDRFRRSSDNLYQRVRALFFLYAIHRFHLPPKLVGRESGRIPFTGYENLLGRRFNEAIDEFLNAEKQAGPSITMSARWRRLTIAWHFKR